MSNDYEQALEEAGKCNGDLAKVFEKLCVASEAGHADANYALATWYLHGKHVAENWEKAVEYLRLAAEKDHPQALYDLAVCFEKGAGVEANNEAAFELYLRAALWGDVQSHYEVSRCYFYGIGVESSERLSEVWMERAESLGYEDERSELQ